MKFYLLTKNDFILANTLFVFSMIISSLKRNSNEKYMIIPLGISISNEYVLLIWLLVRKYFIKNNKNVINKELINGFSSVFKIVNGLITFFEKNNNIGSCIISATSFETQAP